MFYNFIYAILSLPLGILADKLGLKRIYLFGLVLFAAVYLGMSFDVGTEVTYVLFIFYGAFSAATEGISKAWISNICEKKDTATAIGTYAGLQSISAMLASTICGLIWFYFGAQTTFILTATIAIISMLLLYFTTKNPLELKEEQAL